MKVNRIGALMLAGVLTCTAPAAVYASDTNDTVEEIITDTVVDSLLSNPDKVADIVIYVKDLVDQQDFSDEELLDIIDQAADHFDLSLSDSEKESVLKLVKKFKETDIDEEQLRSSIQSVYDKMESLGIDKEDVKGIFGKVIDLAKSFLD